MGDNGDREGAMAWIGRGGAAGGDSWRREQKEGGSWRLQWSLGIRVCSYYMKWRIIYRDAYLASKNRVVPRAGTMGRSGGPGIITLSCRAGAKHYLLCLGPGFLGSCLVLPIVSGPFGIP
jgi:hypothetical protein